MKIEMDEVTLATVARGILDMIAIEKRVAKLEKELKDRTSCAPGSPAREGSGAVANSN